MPPQDLLNHPTTPCSLEACKLAEPQTVQAWPPAGCSALAQRPAGSPSRSVMLGPKLLRSDRFESNGASNESVPPAGERAA